MDVSALLPSLLTTAPLSDPATQPATEPTAPSAGPEPDAVVFSSAPLRLLSELAATGLRQLATLLPAIEQAVVERSPVPLGHLAKAAGAAARQVADGHTALLAEGPDRVAAALSGELKARAAAPNQANQLLRTLARQIGTTAEPTTDARPSEAVRTIARQVGTAAEPIPDARPNETLRTIARQVGTAAEPAADARPSETPRTIARQVGIPTEPATEARPSETPRTIARQVGTAVPPATDAGPSETLRTIVRQVGELATPALSKPQSPAEAGESPARRWLDEAQHLLRRTSDALEDAGAQLRPLAAETAAPSPQLGWALTEITAAQAQLGAAVTRLGAAPVPVARGAASWASWRLPTASLSLDRLSGAASLMGMLLLLVTMWMADGVWAVVIGVVGLLATAVWIVRIGRAAQGITLDVRP